MAKSIYTQNCIREIRQSVFGRDNRKPIADAIESIDGKVDFDINAVLKSMTAHLKQDIIDWVEHIETKVYVSFTAASSGDSIVGLSLSKLSGNDYLLTDSRTGDSATLISGNDYTLNLAHSLWEPAGREEESYISYEDIEHKETYILILTAWGQYEV